MSKTKTNHRARSESSDSLKRSVSLREKRIERMADKIQREVGYFNGWSVGPEEERQACRNAAEKIYTSVAKWKQQNARLEPQTPETTNKKH